MEKLAIPKYYESDVLGRRSKVMKSQREDKAIKRGLLEI